MERCSRRNGMRAGVVGILAILPFVLSCAGSASLSGQMVPHGSVDRRLDQAVVYLEPADSTLGNRLPSMADRVKLTFAHEALKPAVSVAMVGGWLEIWNDDSVFHQPFSQSQHVRLTGRSVRPRSGTAVRLGSKGLVQIFCQLHAGESAEVLVLDGGIWTRPNPAGAFRFSRLPKGRYVIHAWHPRFGHQKFPVDVEKPGPMSVELRY